MSYFTPSPRGGQPSPSPDHSYGRGAPYYPSRGYSDYRYPPLASHSDPVSRMQSVETDTPAMNKVGQERCYWVLVDKRFNFLSLDPQYSRNLEQQADALIGRSLIDFIHPDEQTSAKATLDAMLKPKTIKAQVVRVRYSRLSRIRRQLGYLHSLPFTEDARRLSSDPNYMLVDLVTNWVADGVALCFLHAAMDLKMAEDSDQLHKSSWSNWCETSADLLRAQVGPLRRALSTQLPSTVSPLSVFQILDASTEEILMTWPHDRVEFANNPHTTPVVHPFDLAKLAIVALQSQDLGRNRAKTACTHRFKSSQRIGTDRSVDSIFIPHGAVTFACHKITVDGQVDSSTMPSHDRKQPRSHAVPPRADDTSIAGTAYHGHHRPYAPQSAYPSHPTTYASYNWKQGEVGASDHRVRRDPATRVVAGTSLKAEADEGRSGSLFHHRPHPMPSTFAGHGPYFHPHAPAGSHPTHDVDMDYAQSLNRPESPVTTVRETYITGSRVGGNPPVGIDECAECHTKTSPEWRKGRSGKKDLCNACGLRYARLKAKQDGIPTQRRKKPGQFAEGRRSPDSPAGSESPSSRPVELTDLGLAAPPLYLHTYDFAMQSTPVPPAYGAPLSSTFDDPFHQIGAHPSEFPLGSLPVGVSTSSYFNLQSGTTRALPVNSSPLSSTLSAHSHDWEGEVGRSPAFLAATPSVRRV